LTRIGERCKVIFSGDYTQSDFVKHEERRGLNEFLRVLNGLPEHFKHVVFTENDIVRSKLVKDYLIMKRKMDVVT
jgi:phosphate starvation-inducible PhoH-like protein